MKMEGGDESEMKMKGGRGAASYSIHQSTNPQPSHIKSRPPQPQIVEALSYSVQTTSLSS